MGEFPLDSSSGIVAHLHPDLSLPRWEIKVSAEGQVVLPYEPEPHDICYSAYLFFSTAEARNFAGLSGKRISHLDPKQELLPHDSAGFYSGYHQLTADHSLQFAEIQGSRIGIEWSFEASERDDMSDAEDIVVKGSIRLKGAVVSYDDEFWKMVRSAPNSDTSLDWAMEEWQPDWASAESCLTQFFDRKFFDEPEKWRGCVYYPARTE
ncbi:hypothetical protein [Aeoliella sp. SH292]|uniref:hypothetical protein n=1 Tax=Aeoliella sp. SH292 TaxID=3454464 RepID=UPI003F9D4071